MLSFALELQHEASPQTLEFLQVLQIQSMCSLVKNSESQLKFPPDHSHICYFLIDKKPKSLTQQGF